MRVGNTPAWKAGGLDLCLLLVSAHTSSQVCTQAEGTLHSAGHEGHGTFKESACALSWSKKKIQMKKQQEVKLGLQSEVKVQRVVLCHARSSEIILWEVERQ